MKPIAEVATLLERHPLFSKLPASARGILVREGTRIDLDRGELLYEAGQPARGFFALLKGAVQIEYPSGPEAKRFAAALLPAPAFLGEAQVLHDRPWSATGTALFSSVLLGIKPKTLENISEIHPQLAWSLYRELAWRFLGAIDAWKYQQLATPEELLARYLVSYAIVHQKVFPELAVQVDVNQQFLARATSLRRETVNRLLGRWQRNGWLERTPNALVRLDLPALRKCLSDGGATLLLRSLYADRV
jgi:CRP-like cAMP-binding protein